MGAGTMDWLGAPEATDLTWPDVFPEHLSASQLNLLQRCPEQWRRRYIHHERDGLNGALVWGGADHYAHEQNFRQKISSHEDIPVEELKEAFAAGFDKRVDEGGGESQVDWGDDTAAGLKDAGVMLAAAYHEQVSPSVQPIEVESKFDVRIPGLAVPVIGYIDVTKTDGAIERKTAKAKTTTVKPRWRIQGLIYQLASAQPVEWHVSVKTKTPSIYTPVTEPGLRLVDSRAALTERLVLNLAAQLVSLYETFGPDEPWPGAITDDWACSYCGFGPRGSNNCAWWS